MIKHENTGQIVANVVGCFKYHIDIVISTIYQLGMMRSVISADTINFWCSAHIFHTFDIISKQNQKQKCNSINE